MSHPTFATIIYRNENATNIAAWTVSFQYSRGALIGSKTKKTK